MLLYQTSLRTAHCIVGFLERDIVFESVIHAAYPWRATILGVFLTLARPLYADNVFQIDLAQASALPGYTVENVGTWDQFKRIDRYGIDTSRKGIVLAGPSMGGAGAVIQTMILPDPWRGRIAYSAASAGVIIPRQITQRDAAQYISFPPDNESNKALWDRIDFSVQAAIDPIVRGIHYRHSFSSDDPFSRGVDKSTQLEFVNLVEKYMIGGAFVWVKANHGTYEPGVNLPDLARFESPEQDVTLDRAHPAISRSTGNFPTLASDRINEIQYPRGHYNMGITWDHANIVDEQTQIIFPLKHTRRTNI
jgi:hypothetical protein